MVNEIVLMVNEIVYPVVHPVIIQGNSGVKSTVTMDFLNFFLIDCFFSIKLVEILGRFLLSEKSYSQKQDQKVMVLL